MMVKENAEKLDCTVRVITPENIEFEYRLAGPFQRLPAFIFDFAFRAMIYISLLVFIAIYSGVLNLGETVFIIAATLLFFILSWFYGIYFETRFNGRTLGKMVFKLRVISTDGRPINGVQAALRNLLRLADMCILLPLQIFGPELPPAYVIPTMLVGLMVMTISPRMQRLGDWAAGTMVVSEQSRYSPWNLQPDDLRAFGLAELIPASFQASNSLAQTVGMYMENRKRLSPLRRQEVARKLAAPLIQRFELLPDTGSDLLLCALYVRVFMSEQQRLDGQQRLRQQQRPAAPPPVPQAFRTPSAEEVHVEATMVPTSAGDPSLVEPSVTTSKSSESH